MECRSKHWSAHKRTCLLGRAGACICAHPHHYTPSDCAQSRHRACKPVHNKCSASSAAHASA
eukprot:15278473-Alexandrium_andersonii.AAC.1